MKTLVTGGAGFLGTALVKELIERDEEVVVLDNLSSGTKENLPDEVNFVRGDIRNKEDVERASENIDVVFHLAAKISVGESMEKPGKYIENNVTGTTNVLEANKDKEIVHVSSAAVYGKPERVPIDESHPLAPGSFYGVSKKLSEEVCRSYRRIYGTNITITRPFNIYGRGQDPESPYAGVITKFINRAKDGRDLIVYGDGKQTRDFVHKRDVVRALMVVSGENDVFNIGTGEEVSVNKLAEKIRKVTSSDSEIVHKESQEGDIERSRADIRKLKALNWKPTIGLENGVKDIVN